MLRKYSNKHRKKIWLKNSYQPVLKLLQLGQLGFARNPGMAVVRVCPGDSEQTRIAGKIGNPAKLLSVPKYEWPIAVLAGDLSPSVLFYGFDDLLRHHVV